MPNSLPQPFSWLRTRRLALGGFPSQPEHWQALEAAGIRQVFSCCDPAEASWEPPGHWNSSQLTLPDHRCSTPPTAAQLHQALEQLEGMLTSDQRPLYLHCWAGMERSPLLAVGLLCRMESFPFFDALSQVRSLHPPAKPITAHLVVLEQLLSTD
jgi:hypothetical protein